MQQYLKSNPSLGEAHSSVETSHQRKGFSRFLAYAGPAYLVSVGYMDPGNWATDLQGGAQFGYKLIWVLLMSNLIALLLQSLSARLGIVRRRDLAQANREVYPFYVNLCLYLLAEVAIAACDLAEVLGMAIGIGLLTGLPVIWGVLITVLDTFLLFYLQKLGIRKMEAFIISLVALIGISFLVEIAFAKPDFSAVIRGFVPGTLNDQALYIAVGIIGATVMPHNLYLHSALVQTRKIKPDSNGIRKAIKFNFLDTTIALNGAFFVNASILILSAAVFFTSGHTTVAKIEDAYQLLQPMLGNKLAPLLFAIALIAAGQSSTVTGTLAGQVVMEGYLHLRINPLLRRLITRVLAIVPAVITILVFGNDRLDDLLVLSQVVLSLQLGFAVIPLIIFVSDRETMGEFTIRPVTKILSWLVAVILIFLNTKLVIQSALPLFTTSGHLFWKVVIILAGIIFTVLFFLMTLIPLTKKHIKPKSVFLHSEEKLLQHLSIPENQHIAIALDFSINDERLIAYALNQGKFHASYLLIHIVETASAKYSGESADDFETRSDEHRLQLYAAQLEKMGYTVSFALGYKNRIREIVRIVKETKADLLVMGAHHHAGIKDFFYGETVEQVRHKLSIPVLIVS